ncbi:hypothetical protein Neosp_004398 [[Neocosmospora] mangrovei]
MTDLPSPHSDDPLAVRRSRVWAVRTKKLLRPLIQKLTATINQLNSLESDETFTTVGGSAPRFISEIANHTKRLRGSLEDLQNLREACGDYSEDLLFHLNHEGSRDTKTQAQMAGFAQNMTFLIVGAIPAPLAPNVKSFFGLIIILMATVWSTIGIMVYWKQIAQRITGFCKALVTGEMDLERQQE